jgi:hypothetical protein
VIVVVSLQDVGHDADVRLARVLGERDIEPGGCSHPHHII